MDRQGRRETGRGDLQPTREELRFGRAASVPLLLAVAILCGLVATALLFSGDASAFFGHPV